MVFQFGHIGPAEMLAPFDPFQTHAIPSEGGALFGNMENGRPFYFDPHGWMQQGLTGGTSIQFIGFRNSGKTTAAQVAAARSSIFQVAPNTRMRVSVDDTRTNAGVPEYKAFATALNGKHTDLSRHKINILDPKMGMSVNEQRLVISNTIASVSNMQLTVPMRTALLTGIHVMNREVRDAASTEVLELIMSTLSMGDYKAYRSENADGVLEGLPGDAEAILRERLDCDFNISEKLFKKSAQHVAESLTLLHDEYGDVFGGTNSIYDVLNDPVVALDLTGLPEDVIAVVEMMLWMWRNAAIRRHDHSLMAHFEIHDENWQRWESELYGRNFINRLKKIRASGSVIIKIMHRPTDVLQVGHAGQRQQSLAMSGIRETDVWFIGNTPRADHDSLLQYVQLEKRYLNLLPELGMGDFVVVIGEKTDPFRIHLDITDAEKQMTATNQALEEYTGEREGNLHEISRN